MVDDNHTNRRVLEEVLLNWGALPSTVADGPAALVALREAADAGSPFAIALIDGMMPEMDGFELASRIRELPGIDEPLMVMLTSSGLAGEAQRSRDAGIAVYLTKPVRQSELLLVLTRIVGATPFPKDGSPRGDPSLPTRVSETHWGLRILLAEDHVINQKVAVAMLRRMGHEPTVVGDGRDAIEAWSSRPFDLILMDIQMPVMDGFAAVVAIRAREREIGGRVPIVALTAHAMKGDRERCLEAGFDDHLTKPILASGLSQVIERWASRNPKAAHASASDYAPEAALDLIGDRR